MLAHCIFQQRCVINIIIIHNENKYMAYGHFDTLPKSFGPEIRPTVNL